MYIVSDMYTTPLYLLDVKNSYTHMYTLHMYCYYTACMYIVIYEVLTSFENQSAIAMH